MKTNLPPLPLECTVSVTLEAECSIPGCNWRATLVGAYDKMPSIKPLYGDHLRFTHPGYQPCARPTIRRLPSVPVTPESIEVAKAELAAVLNR